MIRWARPAKSLQRTLLAALFLTALAVRLFRAHQLAMVSPDALRYILLARELPVHGALALRVEAYHPLFSVAILCVHGILAALHAGGAGSGGQGDRLAWVWAAQAVGIFCGGLLSVLIYALARQWGARFWPALAAGALWILTKRTSAFGIEGDADTLALCFFAGSMLLAMRAMHFRERRLGRRQGLQFAGSGLLAGLAYLTRPEGLAAPLMIIIALSLWSLRGKSSRALPKAIPRHALPPAAFFKAVAILLIAAAIPALPYMLTIGGLTHKKQLLPGTARAAVTPAGSLPDGRVSDVALESAVHPPPVGQWMLDEIGKTFSYACLAVLVVGLLWHLRLPGRARLRMLALVWGAVWMAVMLWLVRTAGYLNGRHTLVLQLLLFSWLGVALQHWQRPVAVAMRAARGGKSAGFWPAAFAVGVFVFLALRAVVQLRAPPLGGEGASAAMAARWIQNSIRPGVIVADHQLLAGYFSGHEFARWNGDFADGRTPVLLGAMPAGGADSVDSPGNPPLLLGELYEPGEAIPRALGDYRPLAVFQSAPGPDARGETYILYALPGARVLKDVPRAPPP